MRNIELLSPCGDFERLKLALKFGADAVYLAGEMFGMRTNPSNFNADELKEAGEAGEIRGRSAGKAEGRMQGLREAAINLSNMGIDISIIAQAVNMKETEVKSLLQNT